MLTKALGKVKHQAFIESIFFQYTKNKKVILANNTAYVGSKGLTQASDSVQTESKQHF